MPLPNTEEDALPEKPLLEKVNDSQPLIARPTFSSAVVDTRYNSVASLLKYVEGSSWAVEYFNSIKGANEGTTSFGVNQSAVYEQYLLIRDMDIKVTSPLEHSTNSESNEVTLTGTALLYPGIIPNVGDNFVADMGDGREGIFKVVNVQRQIDLKDSVYEITYNFLSASDSARNVKANLMTKVVRTVYFRKEYLSHGKKLLLVEEEVNYLEKITKAFNTLLTFYIAKFWSKEFRCFLMPDLNGTTLSIYDPYVNRSIEMLADISDHATISKLKIYAIDEASKEDSLTLLSLLIRYDISHIGLVEPKMWRISTYQFSRWPVYDSIAHSGLDNVVYPNLSTPSSDGAVGGAGNPLYPYDPPSLMDLFGRTELSGFLDEVPEDPDGQNDNAESPNPPPLIHSVTKDDGYILSNHFYNNEYFKQSQLELIVNNVLRRKAYNLKYLSNVIEDYSNWKPIDQFYLIPVLLILIKNAVHYQ